MDKDWVIPEATTRELIKRWRAEVFQTAHQEIATPQEVSEIVWIPCEGTVDHGSPEQKLVVALGRLNSSTYLLLCVDGSIRSLYNCYPTSVEYPKTDEVGTENKSNA